MPFGTVCHVALVRTDISEDISSPSLGFLSVIGFHSCVTVETITLKNPEDGDDTFSITLVKTRATWYRVPEGIFN
jgi:hypothetical protein